MSLDEAASSGPRKLFGVVSILMLVCCLAGPAVLGAAAGAAAGSAFGLVAAVVAAVAVVVLLRIHRGGARRRC